MEIEEMDGRRTGGMSARSWKSAARQELAQSVAAAASPTCLYRNSNQRMRWLARQEGKSDALTDRSTVSSFPFRVDGPLLVDDGVSCSGSSEVYPEVQSRADTIAAGIVLAKAKHGDSYPRCDSAAPIPPEPQ